MNRSIIDRAISMEELDRLPIAPVFTTRRDAFDEFISKNVELIGEFDGFILHPRVYDSGYIFIPSKPSLAEPLKVIQDIEGYEEVSALGPLDYALKTHKEAGLITDLIDRIEASAEVVRRFNEIWEEKGVSSYCGVMAVTPMGYLSYYRGLSEVLMDLGSESDRFLSVSMDIAERYPDFLVDYSKKAGVQRVLISFVYSSPITVGRYYFERYVWPPAKAMIKDLVVKGVSPILQFDDPVDDYRFLNELPPKKCLLHLNQGSEALKVIGQLGGRMCIAADFMPFYEKHNMDLQQITKKLKSLNTGLILSTGGGAPLVLDAGNTGDLERFKLIKRIITR